jgi:hypothetical protein
MEATPNPAAKPKANKARPSTHRSDADGAASKESSEPPPSVPVHFRVSGIEQAELKIGPQAFDLRPGGRRSTRIVAGTYPVSWRPSGAVPWTSVGKLVFAPNHDWVIRIDANGPTLTEVGAKGR